MNNTPLTITGEMVKLITTYYGCKLNFANKNNGFEVKISKL